jgi:hypothetical protein
MCHLDGGHDGPDDGRGDNHVDHRVQDRADDRADDQERDQDADPDGGDLEPAHPPLPFSNEFSPLAILPDSPASIRWPIRLAYARTRH